MNLTPPVDPSPTDLDPTSRFCHLCGKQSLQFLRACYGFDHSNEKFDLYRCTDCGLVRTQPDLTQAELSSYYHSQYYGGEGEGSKPAEKFHPWIESLVRLANASRASLGIQLLRDREGTRFPTRIKILDVGCGRGTFLKALTKQGHECTGTEIADFDFDDRQGIQWLHGTVEELELPSDHFDAAYIWHVLEHTNDPHSTLAAVARSVRVGGIVAIAVPNFGSWQSSLFGPHWFHLDLPRHRTHFTVASLVGLLQRNGIEVATLKTLSWEQNVYGWIQSFQNVFFSRWYPNGLYAVLKRQSHLLNRSKPIRLFLSAIWIGLAAFLLIPAILETCLSSLLGRGGTIILHGRKLPTSVSDSK